MENKVSQIKIKPYVVICQLNDGSIKFGTTNNRSFVIPQTYAYLYNNCLVKLLNGYDIQSFNISQKEENVLINLIDELLHANIIEYSDKIKKVIIPTKYRTQSTFFSIFDSPSAERYDYFSRLKDSRILILGMGGVGCHVSIALVNSGIKKLLLLDYDVIEESNLNRQILYYPKDIRRFKVDVAKENLLKIDTSLDIHTINKEIQRSEDLLILNDFNFDLLVCTADYPFHYIYSWINKYCIDNNTPWIQANSAEATGYVGPLVIPGVTSCYGCIESCWEKNDPDYTYEVDYLNKHKELYSEKSSTICPAIGMIGNFTALEIIKHITGFAVPLSLNKQLSLDFGSLEFNQVKYKRVKNCKVCSKL